MFAHARSPADAFDMRPRDWTPERPRGMRRRTYARLTARWEESLAATAPGLGGQLARLLSQNAPLPSGRRRFVRPTQRESLFCARLRAGEVLVGCTRCNG